MTADPPPAAAPPDEAPDDIAALAARLGLELPAACLPGVRHNVALLARHWAALRAGAPPPG